MWLCNPPCMLYRFVNSPDVSWLTTQYMYVNSLALRGVKHISDNLLAMKMLNDFTHILSKLPTLKI